MSLTWYHKNIEKTLRKFLPSRLTSFSFVTNSGARGLFLDGNRSYHSTPSWRSNDI
jgi:hypothetical protein